MQLDIAGQIHQNQRQIWAKTHYKVPSLPRARVFSSSLSGSSVAPSRSISLPPRAPGLWGSHTESGPAVCVLPKQVFKAKLAQHQPSGLPPVPPSVVRDQLQFMILASYSDFVAMCSKTAQLCNWSWRILCLRRPSVHSVSFPEGYSIPATNHILKTLTITKMTNLPFPESLICVSYHTNLNSLSN